MTGAPLKILFVLGTRPEAIKLAPVFKRLREHPHEFETRLVVTGQHRNLLDQALETFAMVPDYDLDIMRPGQSLFASTSRIIVALESVLIKENPNLVLVQGDTTTTLCGALGAFYRCIPVGHVEAGLRTSDSAQPFPEEMNRKLVARLATLDALVAGRIHAPELAALDPQKKMILVTAHRRESFGDGLERICEALATLGERVDVEIIFPIHPNPNVSEIAIRRLGKCKTIKLIEPLAYVSFVDLMNRAHILLTDSGGIQEEGPSLGKPILILREKTERPEAVVAGTARLTGTDPARIVSETALLLDDNTEYLRRSRVDNLFGDGRASARILEIIRSHFAINSAHENRQSVTRS
jgi:UDP-N-acetylglucosamine 2-epimerase (non-hydrolysing)